MKKKQSWWKKLPFATKVSLVGFFVLLITLAIALPYASQQESVGDTRSKAAETICYKAGGTTTAPNCKEGYTLRCTENDGSGNCTQWGCCPPPPAPDESGGEGGAGGGEGQGSGGILDSFQSKQEGGMAGAGGSGGISWQAGTGIQSRSGVFGGDHEDTGGGGVGGFVQDVLHKVGIGGGDTSVSKKIPKKYTQLFCEQMDAVIAEVGYPEKGAARREFRKTLLATRKHELGTIFQNVQKNSAKELFDLYDKRCAGSGQ